MTEGWCHGSGTYQRLLARALTAGTVLLLVLVASSIYRRALLITGHPVRLREVIGGRAVS